MLDQMELSFQATAENEAFARMVISAFLIRINPAMSLITEVRTAVSEAVTNAVVHAYANREPGSVILRAALQGEQIDIEIEDFGCGIEDINQAMTPFYTSQPEQERTGMGFSFMLSLMDHVQVKSGIGSGTIVRMSKLFHGGDADAF